MLGVGMRSEKRMKMISLPGMENWRWRLYNAEDELEAGPEKAERVSRWASWVVGAVEGDGGGSDESKLVIDHRTIQSSLVALESI
jgi:hypothetical protein